MGSLGAPELLIILAIVLLLFGSTRLPKMARSLGQASKEFKKGIDHGAQEDEESTPAAEKPAAAATSNKAEKSGKPDEQDKSGEDGVESSGEPVVEQAAAEPAGESKA
ncbi:MAG: twin-arginine translocase TatA/TatE family subunit [Acidimicrobiia bacterium]|nr:twin-arginine translocase TatA/TatE family subunit [Acidimicrobiia bacterium]